MDLRHLRHFITLAEAGSLHRAARRLQIQQPALSQSIRALEADVGTRLINRSPTGSRLTQAGEAFLIEVRNILLSLDRAVQITKKIGSDTNISLRIGITHDIATQRVAATLCNFQRIFPNIKVIISDKSAMHHEWMLDKNLLDLALLPLSATTTPNHIENLWNQEVYLVLPTLHPLAADEAIDLHHLVSVPLVIESGDGATGMDRALLTACNSAGIGIDIVAPACFLETRLMMVIAGFGVTVLPASSPILTAIPGIVGRPLSPSLSMSIVAAWPASGLTPAAEYFLTIARSSKTAETVDSTAIS